MRGAQYKRLQIGESTPPLYDALETPPILLLTFLYLYLDGLQRKLRSHWFAFGVEAILVYAPLQ
jgi:hypothetical protein